MKKLQTYKQFVNEWLGQSEKQKIVYTTKNKVIIDPEDYDKDVGVRNKKFEMGKDKKIDLSGIVDLSDVDEFAEFIGKIPYKKYEKAYYAFIKAFPETMEPWHTPIKDEPRNLVIWNWKNSKPTDVILYLEPNYRYGDNTFTEELRESYSKFFDKLKVNVNMIGDGELHEDDRVIVLNDFSKK